MVTLLPKHPVVHALPEGLAHLDLGSEVAARWFRFFAPHRRLHRLLVKALMSLGWPVVAMAPWHLWRWCVEAIGGPQALVLRRRLAESRPRSVLSMLTRTNVLCCRALCDQSCHLVVSERNDLRRQALPFPWPRLRRLLYRRADVLTANTSGVLESLARLPCLSEPVLLPNPLPQQSDRAELPSVAERRGFIAVARLVHQKGLNKASMVLWFPVRMPLHWRFGSSSLPLIQRCVKPWETLPVSACRPGAGRYWVPFGIGS